MTGVLKKVALRGRPVTGPAGRARVRPSRDVLMGELDGVAVLLDLKREVYLGLDEVGTTIWREVERGSGVDTIVDAVCAGFDAPREVVYRDTGVFLDELVRSGLAVRS